MLEIDHIRNATIIVRVNQLSILVDPMLAEKGSMPSFTEKRFNPQKNPIVELPENTSELLKDVSHCLITHLHDDHLDAEGISFLRDNKVPVICSVNDRKALIDHDLNVIQAIDYYSKTEFLGGTIEGIPARHGYGKVAELMGNVMGFYISFMDDKSVYLSSDTVYTDDVHNVLKNYKPDISVVACGSAQLDRHEPILMTMKDIKTFIRNAPGAVIANHLEAVNHCPTTREDLKKILKNEGLSEKVSIPEDGETFKFI
jgi:L-ascorbate metabolism protein UlaG (beta-lactamase superfamily)